MTRWRELCKRDGHGLFVALLSLRTHTIFVVFDVFGCVLSCCDLFVAAIYFVWVPISDHCLGKNLGIPILALAPIVDASLLDVVLS